MTNPASISLALVEDEPRPSEASAADGLPAALRELRIHDADPMLTAVLAECDTGRVDRALWNHSVTQVGGDEALAAPVYLRARATAIRLERRREREAAGAAPSAEVRAATVGRRSADATAATPGQSRKAARAGVTHEAARRAARWRLVAVGAALAAVTSVGAVAWLASAGDAADAGTDRAKARPKATLAVKPATATASAAPEAVRETSIAQRVADLERAGNWNVLVLYATEWTRKEPSNAEAWRKLGQGYVKLGQLPEAADAAAKATSLAPDSAAAWRDAARAHAGLEQWAQARAAYERVMALAPADTDASCEAAFVARREGRFAAADALVAKAAAAGGACPADGVPGSVAASAAVPAPHARR